MTDAFTKLPMYRNIARTYQQVRAFVFILLIESEGCILSSIYKHYVASILLDQYLNLFLLLLSNLMTRRHHEFQECALE